MTSEDNPNEGAKVYSTHAMLNKTFFWWNTPLEIKVKEEEEKDTEY